MVQLKWREALSAAASVLRNFSSLNYGNYLRRVYVGPSVRILARARMSANLLKSSREGGSGMPGEVDSDNAKDTWVPRLFLHESTRMRKDTAARLREFVCLQPG